ncbi:calpain-10 isoform X4 [Leopardus geoffroyi]|uniref:calpain-10 isoform X4 n=1 Tax=Leopardus geoffroyi TaxID=46844 RepID=UPI001E264D53|nr:calpain-10 isoform X4 [Leopardus geoffroyi]
MARSRESRAREPRPRGWDTGNPLGLPPLECDWAAVSRGPAVTAATGRARAGPRPPSGLSMGAPSAQDAGPGQGAVPRRRLPRLGLLTVFQLLHAAGPVPGGHHVEEAPGARKDENREMPAGFDHTEEICATPRLFADNPQEGQVKQGLLGDCWLLCACAALQKSRRLLDQVIPPGQPSWLDPTYRGSFTCRVWRFGRWVEVTIDDRLPCLAGRLCFSRCQREDVFWLPLLEKVYAKVYGSYEHLWAGQVADALVDLTGGLAERWSLKDLARTGGLQDRPGGSEHRTCRQLLSLKDRCLISCSVLSPRAGARELGEFHAFIVSDLRELRGRTGQAILLLRIQNPWGRRCWQGPWREGGEGWSRVDPAEEATLLSQLQEGEFWVEEEEFLQEFDEVTVGFPITEAGHLQSLYSGKELCHTQELPGAWVKGQSAGGCRNNSGFPSNPKFWLRVSEPSEVYVTVLQRPRVRTANWAGRARAPLRDDRASWTPASLLGKDYQAVGLHIWKVEKRRVSLPRVLSTPPVAGTACHAYDREVHLRCELGPGYYLAVPSTFLKDVPGQFLLRVLSSGRVSLRAPLHPNHSAPTLP